MKKVFAVVFVLCILVFAACGKTVAGNSESGSGPDITIVEDNTVPEQAAEPSAAPETSLEPIQEEDEGPNPVLDFVGPYVWDRCTIMIEADGSHGAKASITWSVSATELSEWSMSGTFDADTLSFAYTNGVKTEYVYGDDGFVTSNETVYKNGSGTIAISENGILMWTDDTEHAADGMLFTFNSGAVEKWDLS